MNGKRITGVKQKCLLWGLPLAASSLSRSGSRGDVGAHEVLLVLAFPRKAEPCFSCRLLGCLLLSDVTSISLM